MRLSFWQARPKPQVLRQPPRFRPRVEAMEDRLVPSAAALVPPVLGSARAAPVAPAAPAHLGLNGALNITGVQLTNLQLANGVLTGTGTLTGTLAGVPLNNSPFTFTLTPSTKAGQCAILSVHLQPIHLSLLGLHVDTSPICLDITAQHGGGLLGDLLCGLTDNLSGTAADPTALQNLLGQVLNGALNSPKAAHGHGHGHAGSDVCTGQCDVLNLTLGPVNLNLLGLHVSLDNCSHGPVQVCVSATASEGLLGSVLCSLSHSQLSLADLTQLVGVLTP
jgi:hypothetical protein